jgi:hypothetical protein
VPHAGFKVLRFYGRSQLLDAELLHDLMTAEVDSHDEAAPSQLLERNLD